MFFHKGFDISPEAAYKRLMQEEIYLLDVRNIEEYQDGHIPQAHLLPLPELAARMQSVPRDVPVFIYCRSGQRAGTAKRKLQSAGYQNVYNIGGVMQWPYPLEK